MKSKILDAVHQTAAGLHKSGTITDVTMREFDKLCLQPVHVMQPAQIKNLRVKARISQSVFAAYLNTSVSTVQKWEIGEKKPSGIALKLLNIVERNGLDVLA
ncbi:MAG: DNA-binding transcriptional regulator [Sideroxydans sp.]|nr:DNA-binding transcriptional regulator [Sideroxydans sp.]